MIKESDIDSNLIYYHGSSKRLVGLNPPSPYRPLFVTPDIEFATQYSIVGQVNGRSTFSTKKKNGYVYIISINPKVTRILDCTNDEETMLLSKYYPQYIIDSILSHRYSIWSIFKYLNHHLHMYYNGMFVDVHDFFAYLYSTGFKDHLGNEAFEQGFINLLDRYSELYSIIYGNGHDENDTLYDLISAFNIHITKLGFNAFKNTERIVREDGSVMYGSAIGLFDVKCLSMLTPEPLDNNALKMAIKKIASYTNGGRNQLSTKEKSKLFISFYRTFRPKLSPNLQAHRLSQYRL